MTDQKMLEFTITPDEARLLKDIVQVQIELDLLRILNTTQSEDMDIDQFRRQQINYILVVMQAMKVFQGGLNPTVQENTAGKMVRKSTPEHLSVYRDWLENTKTQPLVGPMEERFKRHSGSLERALQTAIPIDLNLKVNYWGVAGKA